ncbi:O-methyltransferase [Mycena crocata]|nr:O-methyltransferase [Mycena crocata]
MDAQSVTTLRALANIVNQAVETMEGVYAHADMPLPSLDLPFDPADRAETLLQDPIVSEAIMNLLAATSQIASTVCNPTMVVLNTSQAFYLSSCLRVASELNVVEILREAGPKGLHARDIAAMSTIDFNLLARILRLLATHHIFREVSPNVFANNRISSTIDKGKSPDALFANREDRLSGTSGLTALVEFFSDDCLRSSTYLTDTILNPEEGVVPYNRAFDTKEALYYFFQRPENLSKLKRFGLAMQGTAASEPPGTIFQGFDWATLPQGSVIVDVGGGIGHSSLTIVKRYPTLRVVVQDLAHTIDEAKVHWAKNFVEHVTSGMVEFQDHDFFNPQPVENADVFLLRYIMHNWDDARAIEILKHLRQVARPGTRLIIVEKILPLASIEQGSDAKNIPGADRPSAQPPLLPNWGIATAELYLYDIAMYTMLGSAERTLGAYVDLLRKARWEPVQVHHCGQSQLSHLVGHPL